MWHHYASRKRQLYGTIEEHRGAKFSDIGHDLLVDMEDNSTVRQGMMDKSS